MEMDRARADRMDQQPERWFQFMVEHQQRGERVAAPPPTLTLQQGEKEQQPHLPD